MKKTITFLVGLLTCLTVAAQGVYQFTDPGFEGQWASGEEPGNGWTSFSSADAGALGIIGGIAKGQSPKASKVAGYNSASAVRIYSKSIMGANANGNLTTGIIRMGSSTPSSAENYNYSKISDSYHSLLFAGTPDAVGFYAKFKSGGSPNGRAHFLLHDACEYRDPEIDSQSGHRVGKAAVLISPCNDWTYFEGAFTYDRSSKPSQQYLLGTFTTNPTPGGSAGDELIVDDVRFIYYSTLSQLDYAGTALQLSSEQTTYDLSDYTYDSQLLSYRAKGIGARVELDYDRSKALLQITVKGNDYSVNRENKTVYTLQFDPNSGVVEPDPDPQPSEGEKVNSLDEVSYQKTYCLYNEHFKAYAIYQPDYSYSNLWTAEMVGDAEHPLSSETYSEPLEKHQPESSWMLIQKDGYCYLYNVGARKYLSSPGADAEGGAPSFLTETPTALRVIELGDGNFAFSASDDEYDFICASPQLEVPVCRWTCDDAGSAWQLIENPQVAADLEVVKYFFGTVNPDAELGEPLTDIAEASTETTYVLYNEHFTAYATYLPTYSTGQVWTAGMKGDEGHPLYTEVYSQPLDIMDAGSSWMVLQKEGAYYLYNMGARAYLTTPGYDGETGPCGFSNAPVALQVVDRGNGHYAFTATGDERDFMCAAPQMASPISIWEANDAGASWRLIANPNVAPDPTIAEIFQPSALHRLPSASMSTEIYTLTGVKVSGDVRQLPAGVYILNGKKRWVR